jgi:hypothetical protein
MFSSIITSILKASKNIKIPGGKISLGITAKQTIKSPPKKQVIRSRSR